MALSHVDCYAVQHPGGAETDRRQRQSVAVHLIALSLGQVHHVQVWALSRLRQRASETVLPLAGLTAWPLLAPPQTMGPVVAADLYGANETERLRLAGQWPSEAWQAWREHHDVVNRWAALLLNGANRP